MQKRALERKLIGILFLQPKNCSPIYTDSEGERAPKKNAFYLSNFPKSAQKLLFLTQIFKNLPAEKKDKNFRKIFGNPPLRNPRSAPDLR